MEENLLITNSWTPPGSPNPINTETPTFAVFASRHIDLQTNSKGEHLKPSTEEKYRIYLNKYLGDFSQLPINEISKAMIDEWWSKAISGGKLTTASKAYKFMHSVFVRACADGWLNGNANPCQVKGAQNANTGKQTYTPTLQEVGLVADKINPEFRLLVLLATYAALRFGEVSALKRKHMNLKEVDGKPRYEIDIKEALTYVGKKFVLGTPKNLKGAGKVLLPSLLTTTVQKYLDLMTDKSPDALLFTSSAGGYLRNDVFAKALKKAAQRAGLQGKEITPHSLRRAGGTAYANLGANLNEVKAFIRDSSTLSAIRYVQTTNRTISLAEELETHFSDSDDGSLD